MENAETKSTPLMRRSTTPLSKQQEFQAFALAFMFAAYGRLLQSSSRRRHTCRPRTRNHPHLPATRKKAPPSPCAGVPYHARAEGYIRAPQSAKATCRGDLANRWKTPAPAKRNSCAAKSPASSLPGTRVTDAHHLRSHENNYLAAVSRDGTRAGVAYVDVSTGEFRATELDLFELPGLLESIGARPASSGSRRSPAASPKMPQRPKRHGSSCHRARLPGLQRRLIPTAILREHHSPILTLDGCGPAGQNCAAKRRSREPFSTTCATPSTLPRSIISIP